MHDDIHFWLSYQVFDLAVFVIADFVHISAQQDNGANYASSVCEQIHESQQIVPADQSHLGVVFPVAHMFPIKLISDEVYEYERKAEKCEPRI